MKTVAVLLNAQNLTQTYGAARLFQNINLNVSEGDRLGLIGPNGSGKSTLLQILAGHKEPDSGEVALRRNTRVAVVTQESQFEAGQTVRSIIRRAIERSAVPLSERLARESETLGRVGFTDLDAEATSLSGGWRKRLAIAEALTTDPDLLLLDEPTNHLDLAGIEWLEKFLQNTRFASVVVSHDRYFLENVATSMAELNRMYPDGIFQVSGNYSTFLEKKEEFLEAQNKRQDALANRVRTEIQWLRRGPKARATKAKARIDRAHEMIGELNDLRSRSTTANADFDFTATDRKTKRLIELKGVSYSYGTRAVLTDLSFVLTAGTRVGLVGPNGSGKTTLLRLLRGELQPQGGEIRRADNLRIVYFDQNRVLDPDLTLRQSLAPDGDSVVYQDRTIHVASWAARFLFPSDQLNQPVGRLSGGERARILIAKLMLEPADVLLLDEPTNDLDIPTLEILEESLSEFKGALVLVTHDRYMLDRISTLIIGLDGEGAAGTFADYSQWETWQLERKRPKQKAPQAIAPESALSASSPNKKKLSYLDNRDFETIEARITDAEKLLSEKQALLEDPSVVVNPERLKQALEGVESAQHAVDLLYTRWAELEAKIS